MIGREQLETLLGEQQRQNLQKWLELPQSTLLIMPLPNDFEPPRIDE